MKVRRTHNMTSLATAHPPLKVLGAVAYGEAMDLRRPQGKRYVQPGES